jgi:hypothetical protein
MRFQSLLLDELGDRPFHDVAMVLQHADRRFRPVEMGGRIEIAGEEDGDAFFCRADSFSTKARPLAGEPSVDFLPPAPPWNPIGPCPAHRVVRKMHVGHGHHCTGQDFDKRVETLAIRSFQKREA